MNDRLSPTRKIAYAAMLIGAYVVLNRLVGLAQPGPMFAYNRLGVGIALVIFSSLFLGPGYGALVGVAGDGLGWMLLGQWTGAFNVYLSVYYALVGVVPWLLQKAFGKWLSAKRSFLVFTGVYTVVFAAFLAYFWIGTGFDSSFDRWGLDILWSKVFVTVLSSALFVGSFVALFFFMRKPLGGAEMGSVAWQCFLVEIMTVFVKPLAFYLYCLTFLGTNIESAWNISYGTLVLLSILFAFADIFINIILLRLMMWIKTMSLPRSAK